MHRPPRQPPTSDDQLPADDIVLGTFLIHLRQLCDLYEVDLAADIRNNQPVLVVQRGCAERTSEGV